MTETRMELANMSDLDDIYRYKKDKGKPPVYEGLIRYFPRAFAAVAKVSSYGASKYEWDSWKKVENAYERYSNALLRHLLKEEIEGVYDVEAYKEGVKILHDAQVAWNALARLELFLIKHPEYDITINSEK